MNLEEMLSKNVELPEGARPEQPEQTGEMPPKLERAEAAEAAEAPKLERPVGEGGLIGETVEERSARHRLENAIKENNSIAIEHAKADLAKAKAKAMMS